MNAADAGYCTATELCLVMSISRPVFFSYGPPSQGKLNQSYGRVAAFSIAKLPEVLRERIRLECRPLRGKAFREIVRLKQQRRRCPRLKAVLQQRLAPDSSAALVRTILGVYFRELDNGATEKRANLVARQKWLAAFDFAPNEKTIRRIAARVDDFGGPEIAPLDAYAQQKAIPHARSVKANTTAALATASAAPRTVGKAAARRKVFLHPDGRDEQASPAPTPRATAKKGRRR